MNREQRAALRKLAEEATPGPWKWSDEYQARDLSDTWSLLGSNGFGILSCDGNGNSPQNINTSDADIIAAANPSTILQLLDYIETLEKDAARYLWCKLHPERAVSIFEHLGPAYFDSEIDAAMQGETK